MAKSINQVILMGRLTRDPEQRTTAGGKTIASFSIAVDRGGESDAADFFEVTAWEKIGRTRCSILGQRSPRIGTRPFAPRQLGRQRDWQKAQPRRSNCN